MPRMHREHRDDDDENETLLGLSVPQIGLFNMRTYCTAIYSCAWHDEGNIARYPQKR
jgi:hypothetical protein